MIRTDQLSKLESSHFQENERQRKGTSHAALRPYVQYLYDGYIKISGFHLICLIC